MRQQIRCGDRVLGIDHVYRSADVDGRKRDRSEILYRERGLYLHWIESIYPLLPSSHHGFPEFKVKSFQGNGRSGYPIAGYRHTLYNPFQIWYIEPRAGVCPIQWPCPMMLALEICI
jgi:hypothetical protein